MCSSIFLRHMLHPWFLDITIHYSNQYLNLCCFYHILADMFFCLQVNVASMVFRYHYTLFRPVSPSLLFLSHFGRYVLQPSSGICCIQLSFNVILDIIQTSIFILFFKAIFQPMCSLAFLRYMLHLLRYGGIVKMSTRFKVPQRKSLNILD